MKYNQIIFISLIFTFNLCFANNNESVIHLKFITGNVTPGALRNIPSTNIVINHKKIPLLFDTGESKMPLTLSYQLIKHIKHENTNQKSCARSFSGKECMPIVIIPKITLGRFTFYKVHAAVMKHLWDTKHQKGFMATQASKNGVIGLKLIDKYNLFLNYKKKLAILYKNIPNLPRRVLGRNV